MLCQTTSHESTEFHLVWIAPWRIYTQRIASLNKPFMALRENHGLMQEAEQSSTAVLSEGKVAKRNKRINKDDRTYIQCGPQERIQPLAAEPDAF